MPVRISKNRVALENIPLNLAPEVDVASAATANIGAATSNNVRITGTTTITAFDNVSSGVWRLIRFGGALTLTHNATSLILPGGANITTASGDSCLAVSLGSGNWIVHFYQGALNISGLTEDTAPDAAADYVPTYDASAAANKKVKLQEIFGLQTWESKLDDTVYQAATDGFVVAHFLTTGGYWGLTGYTDSSNPPTTIRARASNRTNINEFTGSITFPVKKNDYWQVVDNVGDGAGSRAVWWIPATT